MPEQTTRQCPDHIRLVPPNTAVKPQYCEARYALAMDYTLPYSGAAELRMWVQYNRNPGITVFVDDNAF